ncbi:peptidylprolyl isomerase [Desulfoluna sp.]|uniref:FKBP-type peptidyl-prolyl cis-trans isomerase n=1 Tax=Desulfoluna sp. TaxID=2045199 RepID=UPI0026258F45|nr:peptidylprolyl isomerase [Desulfoluna sp.]
MDKVKNGLFVQVAYKGTLADGEVFDSSEGRAPLEIQMGAGQLIPGFEAALMDLSVGDKKTFTLAPEEAYGERSDEHSMDFPAADVPPEMNPEVGQSIALSTPEGQQIPALITHVDDEKVTVDLNHPLAGKTLTFEIEVMGITEEATQQAEGGCAPSDCSGCGGGCH